MYVPYAGLVITDLAYVVGAIGMRSFAKSSRLIPFTSDTPSYPASRPVSTSNCPANGQDICGGGEMRPSVRGRPAGWLAG